ncbi:MAG TPA: hypothetical protein VF559_11440 [Caulobacteraceae bacterium]|jgi:hypothetical protein
MTQPPLRRPNVEVARGDRHDMRLEPDPGQLAKAEPVYPTDDGVRPSMEHSAGSERLDNPAMPPPESVEEENLPSVWEALSEDGAAHRRE